VTTPAEELAARKPRKRAPRNEAAPRKRTWRCTIRDRRESLNLSLRDVANAVGVSTTTLHQIEHGTDPQLTTARKLALFFGANEQDLWPARVVRADD
jgi:DNA-binding XRE family transcriptional regulator